MDSPDNLSALSEARLIVVGVQSVRATPSYARPAKDASEFQKLLLNPMRHVGDTCFWERRRADIARYRRKVSDRTKYLFRLQRAKDIRERLSCIHRHGS